jgi:hypothetical protein
MPFSIVDARGAFLEKLAFGTHQQNARGICQNCREEYHIVIIIMWYFSSLPL